MTELTEMQREVLRALVDTVVPAIARDDDPTAFWATPGTATGAHQLLAWWLENGAEPAVAAGLSMLLDGLAGMNFLPASQEARETQLGALAAFAPEAELGINALITQAKLLSYATADAGDRNPLWPGTGYPGPQGRPRLDAENPITAYVPVEGEVLECDVVVVGSGAGGGTIAGTLAARGRNVVVLEAGGLHTERDFRQLELWANEHLLYRGGPVLTADGNAVLFAGSTLGGGTTVNWQNWVRPSPQVRAEWAGHGLADIATREFDRHIDAVSDRVGATGKCSDLNGPHQRMIDGARRLGWSWRQAVRNADASTYDPELAGYTHYGDLTGSKQGTLTTYLADAAAHGTRILTSTRADRILLTAGRAAGVSATYTDPATGAASPVTVRAANVVVACGALETPALLLRSGLGGPAVGTGLRIHPAALVFGEYADPMDGWWGPPQAAVVDEFRDTDGHGWLIENSHFHPGGYAALLPWESGREHKEAMSNLGHTALFLAIVRERGGGTVTLDADGRAVHHYAMDDELDRRQFRAALASLIRLHEAAGARRIRVPVRGAAPWTLGDDLEAWIAGAQRLPIGAGGLILSSAHQMGTARLGVDPLTSAGRPSGELHDADGVWIGDTSAFPTASGANPMCTCMALARRTAEHILGESLGAADPRVQRTGQAERAA
jgi:choline dehydrogenase-like flavoprotein